MVTASASLTRRNVLITYVRKAVNQTTGKQLKNSAEFVIGGHLHVLPSPRSETPRGELPTTPPSTEAERCKTELRRTQYYENNW